MTLALGTSSPVVSVALLDDDRTVVTSASRPARGAASAALVELVTAVLAESNRDLKRLSRIVVDVGPGSFTGVKVGVTFAKTMAWTLGVPVFAVTSFDLVAPDSPVAIPSKKNEWYVRRPGEPPVVETGFDLSDFRGYGPGFETETMPDVAQVALLLPKLTAVDPFRLVPLYVAEPSVSLPKKDHVLPVAER